MTVRLAVFGGIYSNHLALRAALADIARRRADQTWCLGDLGGFGPHPDRSVEILRHAGIPMLRGNYDDSIGHDRADCACGYTDPRDNWFAQLSYDYTVARTSSEHKAWMRDLPEQQRLEIGGRRMLLCHGSPRRVNEFLWDSACSDAFLEWLCEAYAADLILCTHTGLHWHRALPSGRHVVNVGAIGRPANDGRTEVWYAGIEIDAARPEGARAPREAPAAADAAEDWLRVEFRPVAYEHEALAREMEAEGLPAEFIEAIHSGWWTTCLENMPAKERLRGRF